MPPFPSHNGPPTFVVLLSNHSSGLDSILDTFNSTVQQCKQEIDEGVYKQDSRVIFLFHDDSAADAGLFWRAKSIFAPNSYFRSMPKVAMAFVTGTSEEGRIMIYRHAQV